MRLSLVITTFITALIACNQQARSQDNTPVPAGFAIDLMFDQVHTSKLKAKGLLQRTTFADLLAESEQRIQLAFVIDGTDSMGADIKSVLASIDKMIEDLKQQKGAKLELDFNLVVYRDTEAPAGDVVFPMGKTFTGNVPQIKHALDTITTQPGVPYFEELIDIGLFRAITELEWQYADNVSRWILLFGDAPPYDEEKPDADGKILRKYSTAKLVEAARERKIVINSILCSSGFVGEQAVSAESIKQAYSKLLPRTRGFLSQLTTATGGANWDLSSDGLRAAMLQAAAQERTQYRSISPITPSDVEATRTKAADATTDSSSRPQVRLAVLPHSPLREISFNPTDPAVQVSTEMRYRFGLIPGVEVRSPTNVEDGVRLIGAGNQSDTSFLKGLAEQLEVDFVIWGRYRTDKQGVSIRTAAYAHRDGTSFVEAEQSAPSNEESTEASNVAQAGLVAQLSEQLADKLSRSLNADKTAATPARGFATAASNALVRESLTAPLSSNVRAMREMLAGYEALERSLGWPRGSEDAAQLSNSAILSLGAAAQIDTENPMIYYLLANAYFNRIEGDQEANTSGKCQESLRKAYDLRDKLQQQPLRKEIEALYALLIEKDSSKSIDLYESLLAPNANAGLDMQLRAHWMLSGIYSGDWGATAQSIDSNKARHHIVQILAHWDRSPEATFYREVLHWDDTDGTRHPFVPIWNAQTKDLAIR